MRKKDKKPKVDVPARYAIVTALAKSLAIKQVDTVGVVADPWEWEAKLALLGERIRDNWRGPDPAPVMVKPRPIKPPEKKSPTKVAPAPKRSKCIVYRWLIRVSVLIRIDAGGFSMPQR
jgi:hypothetical protein